MSIKVTNNIDLEQNQIISFVIDKRATAPAIGVQGQYYHNTTNDVLYKHNGTNWVPAFSIEVGSDTGSVIVTETGNTFNLDVNIDDVTIELGGSGELRIKDGGVSNTKLSSDAVTTVKVTDKAITFQKIQDIPTMTVIGRVVGGTGEASAITILNDSGLVGADGTNLATAGAIKAYVDGVIASLGTIKGSFDAANETQFPSDADIVAGDYWRVISAGTVQGKPLQNGDIIQAAVNNPSPTDPNDWIFIEGNRDQATTTVLGLVMLATQTEVNAGIDSDKVVTPATLEGRTATETRTGLIEIATEAEAQAGTDTERAMTPALVKSVLQEATGHYAANIGGNTSIAVTHGLGTRDVICDFFIESTRQKVLCDYTATSDGVVTVNFSVAPAANYYRIVIKK